MKNIAFWVCTVACLVAMMGCAGTEKSLAEQEGLSPESKTRIISRHFYIGPEDVLDISVWQNPDLSRTVIVRPDGKISLPLIGDVNAAGYTPDRLKTELVLKLKPYISNPTVTVIVQQINSWKIYVLGEVNNPGEFPIRKHTTLSQAIAMAGGFTAFAKKGKIRIQRKAHGMTRTFKVNYKNIISGKHPQDDLLLDPGDTVIVP